MSERDDEPGGAPDSDPDADPKGGWAADLSRAAAWLTVLWRDPSAADPKDAPAGMAGAARAFPVIGVGLGVAAAAAYAIGDGLGFYGLGSAVLALALVAALTGARGEVGAAAFAARCFGGGADGDDARAAAQAGLILVVFGIALRIGLLAAVGFAGAAAAILVAAVAVSRIAMPIAAGWGGAPAGPAPDDDADEAPGLRLWVVALVGVLLLILFVGLWGAIVSAILAVAAAITPVAAAGRTGDLDRPALWAVQQAVEIAVLAGAVATL